MTDEQELIQQNMLRDFYFITLQTEKEFTKHFYIYIVWGIQVSYSRWHAFSISTYIRKIEVSLEEIVLHLVNYRNLLNLKKII